MSRHGYAIGEQAKPYFQMALEYLRQTEGAGKTIDMLDLGCSYGIGAGLMKYKLSFFDMMDFFREEAPEEFDACIEATRSWLRQQATPGDVRCVGTDSSEAAIHFANESGLIDGGIARNFEEDAQPSEEDVRLFRRCRLLTSTGAIGYVGRKTLSILLKHLGKDHPGQAGPYAVVTILRMFDPEPIRETFKQFGLHFDIVPGIHLRQRKFTDKGEQDQTLALLEKRGIGADGLEEEGILYADLYLAAPPADYHKFHRWINATRIRQSAHTASAVLAEVVG